MKRARYHGSLVDANTLETGQVPNELPDTYIIFITTNDTLGFNLPICHINRTFVETGQSCHDQLHIIYVNSSVQDDTALGRLMHDLHCSDPHDMHSEILAQRVLELKETQEIRDQYNIDLTDSLNLRIALSLHTASLIVRIKYNMQLKNHLVDYIKQTFPQGFDLGIYFASHLQEVFHKKVTDDEIAFLAIHLYTALASQHQAVGTKKVLVISSMRQSENILLKQTLLNWFAETTSELTFKTPEQIEDKDIEDYDIFLTTERNHYYDAGLAFYVDPFPGQQDYLNLKLAIDGFQSIEDITSIFYKDLYSIGDGKKREKIVENMCQKSSEYFELDEAEFKDAVFQRENMRSTYWGNGIAVPHPLTAVSSDSFVAVTELPQAVVWDDQKNMVNLVLMVCVGKNSSKAFQLWNYLAKVFSDKHFVERLLPDPSYEHFDVVS